MMKLMRISGYDVLFERSSTGFCAHVPSLPVCFGTARTLLKLRKLMAEAIVYHLEALREDQIANRKSKIGNP